MQITAKGHELVTAYRALRGDKPLTIVQRDAIAHLMMRVAFSESPVPKAITDAHQALVDTFTSDDSHPGPQP